MAEQQSYKKPDWTVWDFTRFALRGIPRNDSKKTSATLKFKMHNGNPRFTLYLNKEGGSPGGLVAAMEPNDIYAMFECIRKLSKSKEPDSYMWRIKSNFVAGKRLEKPVETARISVGLDEAGWMFISVQPYKQDLEIFRFKDSFFSVMVSNNGEPLSPRIMSAAYANGWANRLEDMVSLYYMTVMKTDPNQNKDRSPNSDYAKQYPVNKPESTSNEGWGASGDFDEDVDF
jgi:hypothetical protein